MKVISKTLKIFGYCSVPIAILVLIGKFCQPEYQMLLNGQGEMLGKNIIVAIIVNLIFNIYMILGAGLLFYSMGKYLETVSENHNR